MSDPKAKLARVNVKARARLFEQAVVEPPDISSRRGSAETKRKHAEAALKAKTVQQVLKQVAEPAEEGAPFSRRGSLTAEPKKKRGETALKAKTVEKVLKQVTSQPNESESTTPSVVSSRESAPKSDFSPDKEKSDDVDKPENDSPERDAEFDEAEKRRLSDVSSSDVDKSDIATELVAQRETEGNLSDERSNGEGQNKIEDNLLHERDEKNNETEKNKNGSNSDGKGKKRTGPGKAKKCKPSEESAAAEEGAHSADESQIRRDSSSSDSCLALSQRDANADIISPVSNSESKEQAFPTTSNSESGSVCLLSENTQPEAELKIAGLLKEECENHDLNAISEPNVEEANSLTKTEPEKKDGDEKSSHPQPKPDALVENKRQSSFWRTLSDSGSSVSSSASEPECAALARLSPLGSSSSSLRWQGRARSEPSSLLNKLGLGASRSSTSSPELSSVSETNWLQVTSCSDNEGPVLHIGDVSDRERSKCKVHFRSEANGDEVERSRREGKKVGSKFVSPSSEGSARLPAGWSRSIFSSPSCGADKWRLKSEERDATNYYGSEDYELQLRDENPSLLDLLTSVQKIQEEFGQPTFDIPEEEPKVISTTKRKSRPLGKSVTFPAQNQIETSWQCQFPRANVSIDNLVGKSAADRVADETHLLYAAVQPSKDVRVPLLHDYRGVGVYQSVPTLKSVQFQSGPKPDQHLPRWDTKSRELIGSSAPVSADELIMERRVKPLISASTSIHPIRKFETPSGAHQTVSKPLSPTSKVQVTPKPELPVYLTLGRRGGGYNRPESSRYDGGAFSDSERAEFEKIDSILSELDFSKYRRGRSNTLSPQTARSLSESPRPGTRQSLQSSLGKCAQQQQQPPQQSAQRLQVPPHTYRQYSLPTDKPLSSPVLGSRHKLKELTEKLKPQGTSTEDVRPPSPRLPAKHQQQYLLQQQLHNQQLQQQLLKQHKQLQLLQQQHLQQLQRLQEQQQKRVSGFDARPTTPKQYENHSSSIDDSCIQSVRNTPPQNKGQYYASGSLTLPHRTMDSEHSVHSTNPKIEIESDNDNNETATESASDEGLVADSAASSNFAQTYHNVTSTPPSTLRRQRLSEIDPRTEEASGMGASPDRRGKRRKNVSGNVGFQLNPYESKSGNGRSLTYPPQRKGSICEEIDFTSVDSNGMRSFGGATGNVTEAPRRQPSEVSLADSHFSPSESNVCETYLDVIERVTQAPNDADERTGKCLKKKHYSDPSGEKNDTLLDLPEFIAAAKSDPQLGSKMGANFQGNPDDQFGRQTTDVGQQNSKPNLRVSHSAPVTLVSSDAENSDKDPFSTKSAQQQRRYFKKRLRGPYGEMLEEEMRKSGEKQMQSKLSIAQELSFLQDIMDHSKTSGSSLAAAPDSLRTSEADSLCEDSWREGREASSDNGKEGIQDTRTHVVGELYDTERSYVESLQILVNKYYQPLKSSENAGLVDSNLVDDMFFQIPEILCHHESFLDLLRNRLESWDSKQKVGDVFVGAFTQQQVINTYTAFINNWKTAKEAIKLAIHAKPAFAKFLEHMSREHKGKLTLDALLIMPVQRIPRYELLIKELLKHTQVDHPDHRLLVLAQKEVHELAVKINRMEREAYAAEQMLQKLKEIENIIDGLVDLVQPDRSFLRYDLVTMSGGLGTKKERCLFLFSDLLIITSIKRKSGTAIRKASAALNSPAVLSGPLEMNKYKLLMKLSLEDLDMSRTHNDMNLKKTLKEIDQLEEDATLLGQISELSSNLNCSHQSLEEIVREMLNSVSKQLQDKHSTEAHLLYLELTVTTQEGIENLTIVFSNPEKRSSWESAFTEAKQKLALTNGHRPPPEFISPVPIRKTRAGLQFTCATPTLGLNAHNLRDVWVCNSDGYVGQVCVLSLQPDPTVTSCNGVSNARILCIASVPAAAASSESRSATDNSNSGEGVSVENVDEVKINSNNIQLDSESSEEEDEGIESQADDELRKKREDSLPPEESLEVDDQQPTMWLGTEDGCIHIYNCNDTIRTKKNKVKLQHSAPIYCIVHTDNKVFVSLANGDLTVFKRDINGGWRTSGPQTVTIGSSLSPVSRMISVAGKLWCACQNVIKIINTSTLEIEHTFAANADPSRSVHCMATSGFGVWLSIQNSATIKLFHATTYECLLDLSVSASVTKMLAGCDEIIRQHKSACLRITSLLTCKDLMWVGTSAGVILTVVLPHLTSTSTKLNSVPNVAGIPHGHTGHVRFLTYVEMLPNSDNLGRSRYSHRSLKGRDGVSFSRRSSLSATMANKMLVISGGDGYEDFRNTDLGESAGRDDSTNHLLLWQV